MFDSPHFGRWLEQFENEQIEFVLLPSSPHRRIHPILRSLTLGSSRADYKFYGYIKYFGLPLWLLDKILQNSLRALILRRAIKDVTPAVVHALEIQNAGYIALRAFRRFKPPGVRLVVTNYGSDIFWFRRFSAHEQKIRRLLSLTDLYAAECSRDVMLAREMGFTGEVAPLVPNAGGIQISKIIPAADLDTKRTTIAVKGYHGWVGRAHNVLRALEAINGEVSGYQIVFFSCNWSTIRLARRVRKSTKLDIVCFGKGRLSHDQMLRLFSQSRIYVGISESDGISTSMLEAMSQGAVPIQTGTSCAEEWLEDSGVVVKGTDTESSCEAIKKGLSMSDTSAAAKINRDTILRRATANAVAEKLEGFYE